MAVAAVLFPLHDGLFKRAQTGVPFGFELGGDEAVFRIHFHELASRQVRFVAQRFDTVHVLSVNGLEASTRTGANSGVIFAAPGEVCGLEWLGVSA